jgi:CYTH domain-containing protein
MPRINVEIERKFLLSALPQMPAVRDVLEIEQGYIPGRSLHERLRRQQHRDGTVRCFRTVKLGSGLERLELEDETTDAIFDHLWVLTEGKRLRKRRHLVPDGPRTWEIDEFTDRTLHLAELEIPTRETAIIIPDWLQPVLVRDVTDDGSYSNSRLAR